MTESDTRDGAALVFAGLAVLGAICILLVVAVSGGGVPRGAEIALFAIPVALLAGALAAAAKLLG